MKASDTFTIGEDHPEAFCLIIVTDKQSTVLFLFKEWDTGLILREALAQHDLRMYVLPPESP